MANTQPPRIRNGMLIMNRMLIAKALADWLCIPSLQVGHAVATSQKRASVKKQTSGKQILPKSFIETRLVKFRLQVETTSIS